MKKKNESVKNTLIIFRGKKKAGELHRIENGCEFAFDQDFLKDPKYAGLSFRMPKSPYSSRIWGTNLHPFFAGLLPEGLRFRALVKILKTSEDDLFTLFASAGNRVIGDVYVQNQVNPEKLDSPKLGEIDFYDYFKKIISQESYSKGDVSLAGVQEKISASMVSFPLNIAKKDKSYLMKLNPADKPNLIQNEFACMNLARKCGIETPKIKFVHDRNRNQGLLIERFDRSWNEHDGKLEMLHQEDACQFLGKYPADKYNLSYAEIAEGILNVATAPQASLLKFIRLFAFCYIIGNGDLHAKNISVVTHPDLQLTDLSPGYDLLTTQIYGDYKMSNHFDGKKDNINRKMILAFGKRLGVSETAVSKMLGKLTQDVQKNLEILLAIPLDSKKRTSLIKLVSKRVSDLA